jgi:hypothetical protein
MKMPFGKFKGQPIAEVVADRQYASWLCGQEWFKEKFPHILAHIAPPEAHSSRAAPPAPAPAPKKPKPRKARRAPAGSTTLSAQRAINPKFGFEATVECLECGEPMRVRYGEFYATFRAGKETLGLMCDECLEEPSRELLRRWREQAKGAK